MYEPRVTVNSETEGTGSFLVSSTPTGRRSFYSAYGNGLRRHYMAVLASAGQWEEGNGTISSTELSRDVVLRNSLGTGLLQSGAGDKIDFDAGTKAIFDFYSPNEPAVPFAAANSSTGTIDDLDVRGKGAIRFTGSGPSLAGLAYGQDGKRVTIVNAHASVALTIKHEAGSSTAAWRIVTDTGADVSLPAGAWREAVYDATAARWRLGGGGTLSLAGGTIAGDLIVGGALYLTGDISPSQITANQNDYNPTGLSAATTLRLTTDASRNITGLVGGADGRVIVIQNVGSFNIVLKDADAASTAANRFEISGDFTIEPEDSFPLRYDATSSRWRPWAVPGTPASIPTESIIVAVGDETTDITTGTAKVTFRMPYAFTLTAVRASLADPSSSGVVTVDINEAGTTILSTKLTIDATEKTSTTAATPAVISDAALADDAEMTIDIDGAGTDAKGLKVVLIGHQ